MALIGISVSFGASCGKKAVIDTKVQEGASKLPGASEVMAALEKKDYDGAMAALLRVKQTVTTDEQQVEFTALSHQVKNKMLEASATDQKAAEALTALRAMTMGR